MHLHRALVLSSGASPSQDGGELWPLISRVLDVIALLEHPISFPVVAGDTRRVCVCTQKWPVHKATAAALAG